MEPEKPHEHDHACGLALRTLMSCTNDTNIAIAIASRMIIGSRTNAAGIISNPPEPASGIYFISASVVPREAPGFGRKSLSAVLRQGVQWELVPSTPPQIARRLVLSAFICG